MTNDIFWVCAICCAWLTGLVALSYIWDRIEARRTTLRIMRWLRALDAWRRRDG